MVNEIIKGLSIALYNNFEGVNIYVDDVEQGFEEPAFFIYNVSASENRLLGQRAKRNYMFDIFYFPKTKTNEEIQRVASQLYAILRQIKLLNGSLINGFRLEHKTIDGVLHFFVKYNPIVRYPVETSESMNELDYNFK